MAGEQLRECYRRGYEFPIESLSVDQSLQEKTTVYYDSKDDVKLVQKLLTEREPVNIAMSKHYYTNKLKDSFGWSTGYYGRYYEETGKLAPNIAVYCKTPCYSSPNTNINVINVIGCAFDVREQPDYQYYVQDNTLQIHKVRKHMKSIFRKIFSCAIRHKFNRIVLCKFGCGNFAGPFDIDSIWNDVLHEHLNKHPELQKYIKEISCFMENLHLNNFTSKFYGPVPNVFNDPIVRKHLDETLFVNAWDPWSIIGNGNGRDRSLDGFFGRCTAMALLGWPPTNPYISYVGV